MQKYFTKQKSKKQQLLFLFLCLLCCGRAFSQTYPPQPIAPAGEQRIKFTSIVSSVNTGQDYSPWLNDDLTSWVQDVWLNNFIWVDLTLKLTQHSTIKDIKFFDGEGVFTSAPDSIYALNGTIKTFLGTFTGPNYLVFDDLKLAAPVQADAIIIHKFSNNIPQKIYIYGNASISTNAYLASLSLSAGTVAPAFSPTVQAYTATVSNATTSIKLTPAASNVNASVKVNNAAVGQGSASASIPLSVGANVINTLVTAQDGKTTLTYKLTVTRAAAAAPVAPVDTVPIVKIPIDSTRWYFLNNVSNGLGALTDGNLTGQVNTGYGLIISNYDAYYPVKPGEKIDLYQIKFYSYEGGLGNYPLTVSVIDSTGARIVVGTYVGGVYEAWVGPYPGQNTFNLNKPMKNIKYIVLNCWYQFPTEMQLFGHYTPPKTIAPLVKKSYPLNQYFGINAFEWDFEDPTNPSVVSTPLLNAVKSFTQVRHYMDWDKLESTQGEYTFNPVHSGGWNYDAMYQACKSNNLTVLADLKTLPGWLVATYPADQQDAENVPVPYGSNFADPNSYILQAKVAFQYVARYGSNAKVNPALLSVDQSIRWTDDPKNVVKEGTALISYIECDNERDKWWKGRKAYQTSYEYAANLSAFYDGNKNTMGPGVGVKNADPNIKVVMGGLASADPSYVHGMIEWCKQNRGYNADGTVNLCWDVINYHLYANNATGQSNATSGVAPELSGEAKTAQNFIEMAHEYAGDMPVWVTESGYDVNQGSPQKAPPIGNKTAAQVQADWILRTSLLYARSGIQRVFYYEEYDDSPTNPTQYESSGLINQDKSRRPAADYLYQVNKIFGAYAYKQTLNASPIVDEYASGNNLAYVLVSPTASGKSVNYNLNLGAADSAFVYTPVIGASNMNYSEVATKGGSITVSVSETPTFVVPAALPKVAAIKQALEVNIDSVPPKVAFDKSVIMYPNPSASYLTVALSNNTTGPLTINVIDANTGKIYATYRSLKNNDSFAQTLDVSRVPMGIYAVQVIQGNQQTTRKVIKSY